MPSRCHTYVILISSPVEWGNDAECFYKESWQLNSESLIAFFMFVYSVHILKVYFYLLKLKLNFFKNSKALFCTLRNKADNNDLSRKQFSI